MSLQQQPSNETKNEENELLKFVHTKLLSLTRDAYRFPSVIFHNAKGIGIIHIGYDELNIQNENIGKGVVFTHWKNNEKKASGPIFVNVTISDDYNKELLNNRLIKYKDNSFVVIFKEDPQIYDLCEDKNHCIKLGYDYNIEGIVKDNYDGILIFEINHFNGELKPIQDQDINVLKGLNIKINKPIMHKYYNNNKFSMKDVYEGTISTPSNQDYLDCERLIYEKFIIHFTEKDLKKGTLGHGVRPHHASNYHKMRQIWQKALFERPVDRLLEQFRKPFDDLFFGYDYNDDEHHDYNDKHEHRLIQNKHNMKPNCNVIEKKNEYEIHCELPGIEKKNISIDFNGNNGMLEIEGKRENEEKYDDHDFHVQEISYGNFYRRLYLPKSMHVDNKNVKAKHNNGILTISVPKNEQSGVNQQYRVNIE